MMPNVQMEGPQAGLQDPQAGAQPGGMGMPGMSPTGQGPVPMGPPMPDPGIPMGEPQDDSFVSQINSLLSSTNIAERLRKKKNKDGTLVLEEMGAKIKAGVELDEASRSEWKKQNRRALELAMLLRKERSFPWQNASNVKYPLVATAAMQYSARAYPALVPSDGKLVKVEINQQAAPEQLYESAKRVAEHMSFLIREHIPDWEEDMDKLLLTHAITGICFKKTYYDGVENTLRSSLVYPEDLIVNYHAKSLHTAYRKTEVLKYNKNELWEKVQAGEFLDEDLGDPPAEGEDKVQRAKDEQSGVDESTPYTFYACHTYWDLDGDGYEEPYIITIHKQSGKVLRIIARFDAEGVQFNEDEEIVSIKPVEYFTDFPFIPNPDGSIYAVGYGMLLEPINAAVDSLLNQLIDAGTLNNLQSGFIAKGLRIKMGETALGPNEWRVVNATGEDMKNGIYPMPTKDPSVVLLQLVQLLLTAGNQLASIAEIMVGKMPGQNTPATTTQEAVQQGMAVFTAVYKRVFRSLKKEYKKVYRLCKINADVLFMNVGGVSPQDFSFPDWVIVPGADPTGDSQTARMQKYQFVMQNLLPLGIINPMEIGSRIVKDLELPDGQRLLMQPQPQPDPKAQALQMKAQIDGQKAEQEMSMKQMEMQLKKQEADLKKMEMQMELMFKREEMNLKMQEKKMDIGMKQQEKVQEQQFRQADLAGELQANELRRRQEVVHGAQQHEQTMRQGEQSFKQKQQQQKQAQANKPKPAKGKPTKK